MADISKIEGYNIKDAVARGDIANLTDIEKSVSGSLVSFNDGGDNIPLKSLIANITAVQSGSGTASPTNQRAITGWSQAQITRTGKNLCPYLEQGQISQTTGEEVASDTVRRSGFIRIEAEQTYAFSNLSTSSTQTNRRLRVFYYDRWKTYIGNDTTDLYTTSVNVTMPSGVGYIRFQASGSVLTETNAQVEKGSTPTTYEAHKGITVVIPFGDTYYGCVLDVTNGTLTITHGMYDMGDLAWQYVTATQSTHVFMYNTSGVKASNFNFICSCYNAVEKTRSILNNLEIGTYNSTNAMDRFCVRDDSYTDATVFKTAVTGQKIVFELATPVIINLTPTQVATLLGLNNIFADTGDISLSYFTQNANAINDIAESNMITALNTDVPKTDLTDVFVTGTKNNTGSTISKGTYFYVNNQLALCKLAISANADLTLNTNYELVTAGALNTNQDAATLTVTSLISAGATFDFTNYADGTVIFVYRPSDVGQSDYTGIYIRSTTWVSLIPVKVAPNVTISGYVLTNGTSQALRCAVIST